MQVKTEKTPINDVVIIIPEIYQDDRGFFIEVFRKDKLDEIGIPSSFVQLNQSGSVKNVIRGLHFQWDPPMAKLMRVVQGRAFLVAVDIRKGSKTLGKWFGREFSSESKHMLYAPAGCARGFCVLSDYAEIQYLCTGIYNNKGESGILWNDPEIGIDWPVKDPILSYKDGKAQTLKQWLNREESNNFNYE
ncbi:MAG: dTDP-4-dehydrorhamnose 3,5-epimerase [Desulfobacterales bacterium]|nr:dTDP-4-dehydrorhamnose 3,5-epimerase [Desulfobacterales bacterium]